MTAYTDYYDTVKSDLSPDLLYLDPKNPRLSLSLSKKMSTLSDAEICSEKTQKEIFSTIEDDRFHIPDLIRSFSTRGFAKGSQPILVKKITAKKYLVLEGNRRVASIKTILKNVDRNVGGPSIIEKRHLETLINIPVEIFKYKTNKHFTERAVITGVLSNIHITGAEAWGSMEQAMVLYDDYMASLESYREKKGLYSDERYVYIKAVMEKAANLHNITRATLRNDINIYAVYDALKEADYEVMPEHYSLLDLALKGDETRDFFNFKNSNASIAKAGMKLLNEVCIDDGAIVTNPKDFGIFKYIVMHGTAGEKEQVLSRKKSVGEIKAKIEDRKHGRAYISQLEKIHNSIGKLKSKQFKETQAEIRLIRKIEKEFAKVVRLLED